MTDEITEAEAWAASGAMALTGRANGHPLGPPAGLVRSSQALAARLRVASAGAIRIDPLALLGERAAIAGLTRGGRVSAGGSTRLLRAADGWLAVALARDDDIDVIPAWLDLPEPPPRPWDAVVTVVAASSAAALAERGAALGLPVAALATETAPRADAMVGRIALSKQRPTPRQPPVVVDLSSLWAGPLCGALLAQTGATVVKVESTARPDGGRAGPAAFFDLLNAGKRSVALDLHRREGVAALRRLLLDADVVIEASRPRALEQMGIDAREIVATGRARVWVSITGHGHTGTDRNRVAFGDDAAVAGGLVAWDRAQPVFCADAVADPLSGLVAADAVLTALAEGGGWLLDVAMARVAASFAGPTLPVPPGVEIAPPTARVVAARAPHLGEHTSAVLDGRAA